MNTFRKISKISPKKLPDTTQLRMLLGNGGIFLSWRMTKLNLAQQTQDFCPFRLMHNAEWCIKGTTFKVVLNREISALL